MLGAGSGGEGVDGLAGSRSGNHWMLMVVSVVRAGRLSHRYLAPRRTAARDLRSLIPNDTAILARLFGRSCSSRCNPSGWQPSLS
jgi:hypothetical protein